MDSVIWKCIYSAVNEADSYALSKHLKYIKHYIMESWQEESREKFEQELRIYIQRIQRIKRDLVEEAQETPYQLGVLAGYVHALEQFYRNECEQKNIVEKLAQSSGKTRQILNCLYRERGNGMQHSALAEAIGSTPSSLSNLMKRVLLSGAVEASRSGKNTYYMLTPAGEKYCAQGKQKQSVPTSDEELKTLLEQVLARLDSKSEARDKKTSIPGVEIAVGDVVMPPQNAVSSELCRITSIMSCGGIKTFEAVRAGLDDLNSNEKTSYNVYQHAML